ncbi:MAG: FGGY-family carbohydrate kinase [Pseudomonadota bacterium]|nr:FGGY-family carbohydrate kinase [Pseudomonadota bacterium]
MTTFVCAVDVGTRSARAAFFDPQGRMTAREVEPIDVHVGLNAQGEYRADDIWAAVCRAVRKARASAGIPARDVAALAFDATCSLVLMDADGQGLAFGGEERDTYAWFDRRATAEAEACKAIGGDTIRRLSGVMSPEMQLPKLLWLRSHHPDLWARLGHALDLPDWLTYRATGVIAPSVSALGTKWPWSPGGGWDLGLLEGLGCADLPKKLDLPQSGQSVGSVAGPLGENAARALGLTAGIPVGTGLIDGYAGALGCRALARGGDALTLIAGTSASILALRPEACGTEGLWGPFEGVPLASVSSHEGGITNAGALLDHVLAHWPAIEGAHVGHPRVLAEIETHLDRRGDAFAADLHVLPDFNGSRGPVGDPRWRGVVHGLRLESSLAALAALYWRTAVALALTLAEAVERFSEAGLGADTLAATGGLMRSDLIAQLIADVTGKRVLLPVEVDAVLLGTAFSASIAAGWSEDVEGAATMMAPAARVIEPQAKRHAAFDQDRAIYRKMLAHRAEITGMLG